MDVLIQMTACVAHSCALCGSAIGALSIPMSSSAGGALRAASSPASDSAPLHRLVVGVRSSLLSSRRVVERARHCFLCPGCVGRGCIRVHMSDIFIFIFVLRELISRIASANAAVEDHLT